MTKCLEDRCFKQLLSQEWLSNDQIISTILATSSDYLADFMHLDHELQSVVLYKWHIKLKVEYMKGFLQNFGSKLVTKRSCADQNERTQYSNKTNKEIIQLEQWFSQMAPPSSSSSSSSSNSKPTGEESVNFDFSVLSLMNKIVKADDVDFLGVEIGALIKKFPEITSDMLYALLRLRGDISSGDYKEKYESYCIIDEKKATATKKKPDEAIMLLKKELKIAN